MAAQLKDYSSFAYSMVIDPEGKVIAHSHPSKAIYKLDDEVTKKVLAYRNPSEIFIQKVKLDNRNALDFSLPVFSSSERSEYLGAVRLAMYLD
jgi:hypothetical protein